MKLFLYCFRSFDETPYYDALSSAHGYEYGQTAEYPSLDNAHLAAGADAISATVCELPRPLLERWHELGVKSLVTRSIGFDHIDLEYCRHLGLHVAHVAYPPETVAEYTMMLMLMSLRRIRQTMERAAVQDYTLRGKIGKDLCESTVGIIGTGRIGSAVAVRLAAFGARILCYDPFPNPVLAGIAEYVPLENLLSSCNVITLHVPATAENHHLIGKEAFSLMQSGTILVNTARGTLVDTEALIDALVCGRLGGASLDVIEDEYGLYYLNRVGDCLPNRQLALLRSLPNVILTPHTAFYSERVVRSMAEQVTACMEDISQERPNPLILF